MTPFYDSLLVQSQHTTRDLNQTCSDRKPLRHHCRCLSIRFQFVTSLVLVSDFVNWMTKTESQRLRSNSFGWPNGHEATLMDCCAANGHSKVDNECKWRAPTLAAIQLFLDSYSASLFLMLKRGRLIVKDLTAGCRRPSLAFIIQPKTIVLLLSSAGDHFYVV